jgi:hypothetical protein
MPVHQSTTGDAAFSVAEPCNAAEIAGDMCKLPINFKPTSGGEKRGILNAIIGGQPVAVPLSGMGVWDCRPAIVPCNYFEYYSGSFKWHKTVDIEPNLRQPTTRELHLDEGVTATITNGKVICLGTYQSKETSYVGARKKTQEQEQGPINGPGLITVEFGMGDPDADEEAGEDKGYYYEVKVDCPTHSGNWSSEGYPGVGEDTPVGRETGRREPTPARMRGEEHYSNRHPARTFEGLLRGSRVEPSEENDRVNGVTGTIRTSWSLRLTPPSGPAAKTK